MRAVKRIRLLFGIALALLLCLYAIRWTKSRPRIVISVKGNLIPEFQELLIQSRPELNEVTIEHIPETDAWAISSMSGNRNAAKEGIQDAVKWLQGWGDSRQAVYDARHPDQIMDVRALPISVFAVEPTNWLSEE